MREPTLVVSVFKTLQRRNLLPASRTLVVGVSGGTDSLALLHILNTLRVRLSFRLHVATLDHGLRGAAGADDARFVVEIAQSWGLEVSAGYTDVGALAQTQQLSIETAARIARYDFLASVADQVGTTHIAVAHNADDQVETVLFHILRGSGLSGLGGMAYASPLIGHPAITLIRPLLDIPRADLDAYCSNNGLQPRHDATNDDTTYTRNRLRHKTLPYLRDLSPQIERHLLQLADIARTEDDLVDLILHQAIDLHVVTHDEGRISLPRAIYREMYSAIQRRFIVWAARSIANADNLGYINAEAAAILGQRGEVGARAQLSGGLQLRVDYETIVIELDDTPISLEMPLLLSKEVLPLVLPGVTAVNVTWSLVTSLTPLTEDSGRLAIREESKIVVRTRTHGDRFAPFGLDGHTQKISKWMIDHKVPASFRDRLPLLLVDDQIAAIWWQGWVVSENFAVTPESKRVIYMHFDKNIQNS